MSDITSSAETAGEARFIGVAVSVYDHKTFNSLPLTVAGVNEIGEILSSYAYQTEIVPDPQTFEALEKLKDFLAPDSFSSGGALIVLWSGHGEPAAQGSLHLINRDTAPGSAAVVNSALVADYAARTGASQLLLIFDTCFSGAAALSAPTIVHKILQELPPNDKRIWVGVLASALELQPARDGVFLEQLSALLKNGPTGPELRLRWSAHSQGVRGDDVLDALIKEWDIPTQYPAQQSLGDASKMALVFLSVSFDVCIALRYDKDEMNEVPSS
jgi:hypothetical protein